MATDEDRDSALQQLDDLVMGWRAVDEELLDAMGHALECGVTRNEIARRVTVYSRPTVLSVLTLHDRKTKANRVLAAARVRVLTSDDTEEVWILTTTKPRRGLQLHHEENHLDDGGPVGSPGRASVAAAVAARAVTALYDAGLELTLTADSTRLDRDAATEAFADPDAVLWVVASPKT